MNIRQLRNNGGEVVNRVERGEVLVVTRDGRPVAELRPVRARGVPRDLLIERARTLPPVDPVGMRADLDTAVDPLLYLPG